MKVGKPAWVIGIGQVVVVEYGKGPTARVRRWDSAREFDVEKTKLLAKKPKSIVTSDRVICRR